VADEQLAPPVLADRGKEEVLDLVPLGGAGREVATQDLRALLLITVGALILPIVGPLLGLVLIWISVRLATRVKVAVSVMSLALAVPMLFVLSAGGSSGRSTPSVETSAPTAAFEVAATPGTQ